MCGRFTNETPPPKLIARYRTVNEDFNWKPNGNIAPTDFAPIVLTENGQRVLKQMKWGLIPSWAKDPKIGLKCFNARVETITEKPAFRDSFKSKRCIVPVNGYYEWRDEGKKNKTKYLFTVKGEEIFSLAGLWSSWKDPKGQEVETFTIITTKPNSLLAEYHNRMPVIMSQEIESPWIDSTSGQPTQLLSLIKVFPSEKIKTQISEKN